MDKRFFDPSSSSVCSRRSRRSKGKILKLFDQFPFPIWRAGVEGKCDHVNRAWLDFTGRKLEQELGEGWTSGVHPDDISACLRDCREAVRARAPFQLQYRLRGCDKEWLELRNAGAAPQLVVRDDGIGFDITDAEKRVRRDCLGLVGMRERATAVGGQFECKSGPGHGTEVRALFLIFSQCDGIDPM